jgi:hypothetical protein
MIRMLGGSGRPVNHLASLFTRIPGDTPFVEELKALDPASEGVRLFLEAYNGDTTSLDQEAVVEFCHDILLKDIRQQSKPGSAWMDDRTHASHRQVQNSNVPAALALRTTSPLDQTISCAASDYFVPPNDNRTLEAERRFSTNRYVPDSRRYPAPLTAEQLYEHLRKKVIHPRLCAQR